MDKETIDSVLNFSGGLLVFLAAALPLIRFIWLKARAVPDKEGLKRLVLLILNLILLITAWVFFFFSSAHLVPIALFFAYAALSAFIFINNRDPVTRAAIFFEAVFPSVVFVFMFVIYVAADIYQRIHK